MNKQERSVIELQCYEPAGRSILLSERDLLGHSLVIGGSGAGKTTRIVNPLLKQLIEHQASRDEHKVGVCILDTKADGEAALLTRRLCREAGREKDLVVIGEEGASGLDLLQPIRQHGLAAVDSVAGTLSQLIPECEANKYWEITMASLLRQVLRIMILSGAPLSYSGFATLCTEYLLGYQLSQWTSERIDDLKQVDDEDYDEVTKRAIHETLATHRMWMVLDSRTRSNLQSMAAPIVDALSSPVAEQFLGSGSGFDVADVCSKGRILVISIDALHCPEMASLVGAVTKARFYDSILSRDQCSRLQYRLAGLVLDDWPLCATGGIDKRYSDVSALSLLRSRRGFLIAATQSLAALDVRMGWRSRAASIANFANLFLMRSRDLDTDALAASYLGERKLILKDRSIHQPTSPHRKATTSIFEREQYVASVPVGSLARLPVGDTYALIGETVYSSPHSLVPVFADERSIESSHE